MWPHSIVIGVGDTAVCVGTDDADLIHALAPWAIDEPTEPTEPTELFDYGAQLHPAPAPRGEPRTLANLRHGSDWLASSPDPAPIRDGFLRVLGGLAESVGEGEICLTGLPVVHGDAIELAAPDEAKHGSLRQLARGGRQPVPAHSVVIDPHSLQVRVAGALDGSRPAVVLPVREWRVTGVDPQMTLAQVVATVAPRLCSSDVGQLVAALHSLAQLVRQLPPVAVPG